MASKDSLTAGRLTSGIRRKLIDDFSLVLRDQYVYPRIGEGIVAHLNQRRESGAYDAIETHELLARKLTEDVRDTGHDGHMKITFTPATIADNNNGTKAKLSSSELPSLFEKTQANDFGFDKVTIDIDSVKGNKIATVPIRVFMTFRGDMCNDGDKIQKAIGDKLSSIADCDAVLIDLRNCRGGDPSTVAFMLSYFLGEGHNPLHLLDMVDRHDVIQDSFSTTSEDKLPLGTVRYGTTKPVWVLTSRKTVSGGEDMANNFQAFKRATIVGEAETTTGAANPITKLRYLCEDEFEKCWTAFVPNLRPVHVVTGGGWEGVGILSDVVAGQGDWKHVSDAEAVAKILATKELSGAL